MRLFGVVLLIGFGLLGGLALWSYESGGAEWRRVVGWALIITGGTVFVWSLISPRTLPPVYRGWMKFGQAIGNVVSTILLSALYFVVFFIVGRLMRLTGTDPLDRTIARGPGTYWRKHSGRGAPADYAHMS